MNTERQKQEKQNAWSGRRLSGLEKASVLITSLDPESSAKVVEYLTPEERRILSARILSLQNVDALTRQAVLSEVSGALAARKSASEAGVKSRRYFEWIESVDPKQVATVLTAMNPQDAAMVIFHLSTRHALAILSCMNSRSQDRITQILADLSPPYDELILNALDKAVLAAISCQPECTSKRRLEFRSIVTLFNKTLRVLKCSLGRHVFKLMQILVLMLRVALRLLTRAIGGLIGQRHKVENISRRPII